MPPALVVPATRATPGIARAEAAWDPLLLCVAGYLLIAVGRVHQLFPVLELLRPGIVTGLGAIVLYAINTRDIRRMRHIVVTSTRYLFAMLLWIALSVPSALVPGRSFDLLVNNFLKTVLMYCVIAGAVRGIRDVERLAMTYLAGATVYAGVVLARFDVGQGESWRLGRLYYYDANDFATFAVTALPLGLYLLHAGRTRAARALAVVSLGVLTLAFVRSGSRGGFIALAAVAGFVMLRYTAIAFRWRVTALALVTAVVLATASDQYWKQMNTILSDADYNRTEETGRMQIWKRGVTYMMQNPVFGVGPNNFQAAEGMLSPLAERQQRGIGVRWNAAHNSFVQIGAELGIPGLWFFIGLIVGAFEALRRVSRPGIALIAFRDRQRLLPQALMASLIGFVVGACFLSLAYSEMLYTLVALAVGLQKVTFAELAKNER